MGKHIILESLLIILSVSTYQKSHIIKENKKYGAAQIRLPDLKEPLILVVVKGFGKNLKLKIVFEKIFIFAKRFFGIPSFYSYAMADGIFNYLFDNKYGLFYKSKPIPPDYQLSIIWEEN